MSDAAPEITEHVLDGPLEVTFADDGALEVERVVLTYEPVPKRTPRRWTLKVIVDGGRRQELLALHEAGVTPLGAPQLLRFDILHSITVTFEPAGWLAARLDTLEDEAALVSADAALDQRVAADALDLRNYAFADATQGV